MAVRRIAGNLNNDLVAFSADVVNESAEIVREYIDKNVSPPGGLSLAELRDAGYPLSVTGFRPGAAGLDEEYQIIEQTGGLRSRLGISALDRSGNLVKVYVGFDDSGSHQGEDYRGMARTVDMDRLLSWLIDGTATMVGRPVLINSLGEAVPDLIDKLEDLGLRRHTRGRATVPRAPVVK